MQSLSFSNSVDSDKFRPIFISLGVIRCGLFPNRYSTVTSDILFWDFSIFGSRNIEDPFLYSYKIEIYLDGAWYCHFEPPMIFYKSLSTASSRSAHDPTLSYFLSTLCADFSSSLFDSHLGLNYLCYYDEFVSHSSWRYSYPELISACIEDFYILELYYGYTGGKCFFYIPVYYLSSSDNSDYSGFYYFRNYKLYLLNLSSGSYIFNRFISISDLLSAHDDIDISGSSSFSFEYDVIL